MTNLGIPFDSSVMPLIQVHEILTAEGTDYIILEDSICLAPSDGCRTPDLMDLEDGFIPGTLPLGVNLSHFAADLKLKAARLSGQNA